MLPDPQQNRASFAFLLGRPGQWKSKVSEMEEHCKDLSGPRIVGGVGLLVVFVFVVFVVVVALLLC